MTSPKRTLREPRPVCIPQAGLESRPPSLYLILLLQRKGLRVESGVGHTRLEMGERGVWDSQPGTQDIAP